MAAARQSRRNRIQMSPRSVSCFHRQSHLFHTRATRHSPEQMDPHRTQHNFASRPVLSLHLAGKYKGPGSRSMDSRPGRRGKSHSNSVPGMMCQSLRAETVSPLASSRAGQRRSYPIRSTGPLCSVPMRSGPILQPRLLPLTGAARSRRRVHARISSQWRRHP